MTSPIILAIAQAQAAQAARKGCRSAGRRYWPSDGADNGSLIEQRDGGEEER